MFAMLMGLKSIAPRDLHARLKDNATLIIDLNAPHSWLQARVPGALNLMPDFDAGALPAERSTPLVFYCSNPLCRKAPNAARRSIRWLPMAATWRMRRWPRSPMPPAFR